VIALGTFVPYIIGVPSVRAKVVGLVGDNYVLLQEYDILDEGGNRVHVKKHYYRNRWLIESYWVDTAGLPGRVDGQQRTC
jgi:hypothetical protein